MDGGSDWGGPPPPPSYQPRRGVTGGTVPHGGPFSATPTAAVTPPATSPPLSSKAAPYEPPSLYPPSHVDPSPNSYAGGGGASTTSTAPSDYAPPQAFEFTGNVGGGGVAAAAAAAVSAQHAPPPPPPPPPPYGASPSASTTVHPGGGASTGGSASECPSAAPSAVAAPSSTAAATSRPTPPGSAAPPSGPAAGTAVSGTTSAAGGMPPMVHPQLPEHIWVLDPLTRKLRVPTNLIVPTAATATLGTTPSLCLAFLEHRCRHPWCRQAHIPLPVVQRLRDEAQNAPTCCVAHKAPQDIRFLTDRFASLEVLFASGARASIATNRLAVTVGLQRHLAQVVPKEKRGPVLEVPSRMICRLHLGHRCRYLEDCNNLHVCREDEAMQRHFAELGPEKSGTPSPAASGHPATPNPNNGGSMSGLGTPLASGTPATGAVPPPRYTSKGSPIPGASTSMTNAPGGRSPHLGSLPPPSPLISPQAAATVPAPAGGSTFGASPSASATSYASIVGGLGNGALHGLHPGNATVQYHGRMYSVTTLRGAAVSDQEFATLADAQSTLFGGGKVVEVVDLVRSGGTTHHRNSLGKPPTPPPLGGSGLGMSLLPQLPPAAASTPPLGPSASHALNGRGHHYSRATSKVSSADPATNENVPSSGGWSLHATPPRQQANLATNPGSSERDTAASSAKPLITLFGDAAALPDGGAPPPPPAGVWGSSHAPASKRQPQPQPSPAPLRFGSTVAD